MFSRDFILTVGGSPSSVVEFWSRAGLWSHAAPGTACQQDEAVESKTGFGAASEMAGATTTAAGTTLEVTAGFEADLAVDKAEGTEAADCTPNGTSVPGARKGATETAGDAAIGEKCTTAEQLAKGSFTGSQAQETCKQVVTGCADKASQRTEGKGKAHNAAYPTAPGFHQSRAGGSSFAEKHLAVPAARSGACVHAPAGCGNIAAETSHASNGNTASHLLLDTDADDLNIAGSSRIEVPQVAYQQIEIQEFEELVAIPQIQNIETAVPMPHELLQKGVGSHSKPVAFYIGDLPRPPEQEGTAMIGSRRDDAPQVAEQRLREVVDPVPQVQADGKFVQIPQSQRDNTAVPVSQATAQKVVDPVPRVAEQQDDHQSKMGPGKCAPQVGDHVLCQAPVDTNNVAQGTGLVKGDPSPQKVREENEHGPTHQKRPPNKMTEEPATRAKFARPEDRRKAPDPFKGKGTGEKLAVIVDDPQELINSPYEPPMPDGGSGDDDEAEDGQDGHVDLNDDEAKQVEETVPNLLVLWENGLIDAQEVEHMARDWPEAATAVRHHLAKRLASLCRS